MTDGLGPTLTSRLIRAAGGADEAVAAIDSSQGPALLRSIEGIGSAKTEVILHSLRSTRDESIREIERCQSMSVSLVTWGDEHYPAMLRQVPAAPIVIWVRGRIEPRDLHAVAIVGSRKCTIYGREQAERFGSGLAGVGVTVVSGGARGVDTHAHKGALVSTEGRTIAVLGCGVDVAYPPENKRLLDDVATRGAVVSDFPLGTAPLAENFPRRNRIISGLSRGVLVIEADLRSGSLITARYAADDHNRPVFALPGRIDNPLSAGPHKLIRDGAILVETLADVLDNLGPLPDHVHLDEHSNAHDALPSLTLFDAGRLDDISAAQQPDAPPITHIDLPGLTVRQRMILKALEEPLDADAIVERTGLEAGMILSELTMLSIRGAVLRAPDGKFSRRSR